MPRRNSTSAMEISVWSVKSRFNVNRRLERIGVMCAVELTLIMHVFLGEIMAA